MRSKFILTVAASLLAGTVFAAGAADRRRPDEKGRAGQPTDGAATSSGAHPAEGGAQAPSGTVGSGAAKKNPAMKGDTPLQPGGVSPSAPPQGRAGGSGAQPQRR